jgi:hypothetical protein
MDPLTLFALANGAVSAVKAGCKLYKDIKGAAGEVKDVLKDLDDQFHKIYTPDRPAPPEAKKQLVEEKARIVELNKRSHETTGIYQEIGEHLGTYYDNFYKCIAVFEEEERRAQFEVYTGTESLSKRALQRVLMRKQLEQMSVELRELMIYQCPPELGALHTEVEDMMKVMGKEQQVLVAKQMQYAAAQERRRQAKIKQLQEHIVLGIVGIAAACVIGFSMVLVAQSRIEMYPHLGTDLIPKNEQQRQAESVPKRYTGR